MPGQNLSCLSAEARGELVRLRQAYDKAVVTSGICISGAGETPDQTIDRLAQMRVDMAAAEEAMRTRIETLKALMNRSSLNTNEVPDGEQRVLCAAS